MGNLRKLYRTCRTSQAGEEESERGGAGTDGRVSPARTVPSKHLDQVKNRLYFHAAVTAYLPGDGRTQGPRSNLSLSG